MGIDGVGHWAYDDRAGPRRWNIWTVSCVEESKRGKYA